MFDLFKKNKNKAAWQCLIPKETHRSLSELPPAEMVPIIKRLAPVKILYNGCSLYDDTMGDATPEAYARAIEQLSRFESDVVYEMYIRIVDGHHSIISIFALDRDYQ